MFHLVLNIIIGGKLSTLQSIDHGRLKIMFGLKMKLKQDYLNNI